VQRHLADRMLSLFVTVFRYRCDEPLCGWEGLVHGGPAGTTTHEDDGYMRSYRLEASCGAHSARALDPPVSRNA
jgi:hypothetical protein